MASSTSGASSACISGLGDGSALFSPSPASSPGRSSSAEGGNTSTMPSMTGAGAQCGGSAEEQSPGIDGSGTCGLWLAPRPLSPAPQLSRLTLLLTLLLTEAVTVALAAVEVAAGLEALLPRLRKDVRVVG